MMRCVLAVCAFLCAGSAEAVGEDCIGIENDLDRLACYDKTLGRTPTIVTERMTPVGAWTVTTETSALTDQKNVYLLTQSTERVSCSFSDGSYVTLIARCVENVTALMFQTECHMVSSEYNDYGDVDLRIDDKPAFTVSFRESTNNRTLGLWNGASAIPQIKKLFGGKSLIARMTPYSDNAFTVTFDITGLEEQIKPLREACSW